VAQDPREGVWLGAGDLYVHQALDRWSVFPAGAAVNRLAFDGLILWIATDDGVIRLDTGSRRATRLGMEDGLPSQVVTSVAVDDRFVWFGTNKGAVRYRKEDRTLRLFTEEHGLPHRAVNDLLATGQRVWMATRAGLALYDPEVDGLRSYAREGLADDVAELFPVGEDLWCRTDKGLSRLRVKARSFTHFGPAEIGGAEVRVVVPDGERIWVGTEGGLVWFEPQSDTFVRFPQQAGLEGKAIVGVEPFTDYLFIATDQGLVQWHKTRASLRRFTEADGLPRRAGARGTALAGGHLLLVFDDGVERLDIQRDLWSSHPLRATEGGKQALGSRVWTRVDAFQPWDLRARALSPERYATAEAGAGVGYASPSGRSVDASVRVDYGEIEASGVRDVEANVEYTGRDDDLLREVRASDKLVYRTREEGLEAPVTLLGGRVRAATAGKEPALQATVDAGQRRGLSAREFLTGPKRELYALAHRYILPGTERVRVDGELLVSGTDYTLLYAAGQLAFLDPERVDALSVIEVDYEYDLLPKKGLGVLSLLDFLPADREVGGWLRSGDPRVVSEESGLYAQIDGAAPKYIDRGWVRSVYAEYRQGGRSIRVAVHDMGTEAHAADIYSFSLPPAREALAGREGAVLDIGLTGSYAVNAVTQRFFFELSIDEKSDAAKQTIRLFATQVLDRGENAGTNRVAGARPFFAAARLAGRPADGLEIGGRAFTQSAFAPPTGGGQPGLRAAAVDLRYERALGQGRLTAWGEAMGTQGTEPGGGEGMGAMAGLRFAHPYLEGAASGRWEGPGYLPLGSNRTPFGALRGEGQIQATAYPARWLPATVFAVRQLSAVEGGGEGVVQHALARLQLHREDLPAASLQVGQTLLDGPASHSARTRLVGQAEYDLAQGPLAFLRMPRFALRALYGLSDATTREAGAASRGDRSEQMRFEARLAPTSTESAYALFRQSASRFRTGADAWAPAIRHWELTAGVRSSALRGVVPQATYAVAFDDDRVTGPAPVRASRGSLGAELQLFPGQWARPLAPVLLATRYSLAADDRREGDLRTLRGRVHRVDNRFIYAGMGLLELELYQAVQVPYAGADARREGRRLELANRIVYRPVFSSPITLRVDVLEEQSRNDLSQLPGAPLFGARRSVEGALEWLMRWSRRWSTRLKCTYARGQTSDLVAVDPGTGAASLQAFTQHRVSPELELRVLLPGADGTLYLVQRSQVDRLFGTSGAVRGAGVSASLGAIWTVGDSVYLDALVAYRELDCSGGPCTPVSVLEPRLLFSARL